MRLMVGVLRVLIGGLFIGHGTQKLFGWFGGHGLDATADMFESIGLKPGRENALIAGVSEAGGGALLAAGVATPLAGAAVAGTMVQAIRSVHGSKGPWITDGGWEYNAVLIAAVLGIVEHGPGAVSLDRKLGIEWRGPRWALAALAAALVGPPVITRALNGHAQPSASEATIAPSGEALASRV